MSGRARQKKAEQERRVPAPALTEARRVRQRFLDTFKRIWEEKGSTQAATLNGAGLSVQAWQKWTRGGEMTLGSVIAVAHALDRRIDFELKPRASEMSDPSRKVAPVDNEGDYTVKSSEGTIVAKRLDAVLDGIADEDARYNLMQKCLTLIDAEAKARPSKLGAG